VSHPDPPSPRPRPDDAAALSPVVDHVHRLPRGIS
jgi:hypothetical protein